MHFLSLSICAPIRNPPPTRQGRTRGKRLTWGPINDILQVEPEKIKDLNEDLLAVEGQFQYLKDAI